MPAVMRSLMRSRRKFQSGPAAVASSWAMSAGSSSGSRTGRWAGAAAPPGTAASCGRRPGRTLGDELVGPLPRAAPALRRVLVGPVLHAVPDLGGAPAGHAPPSLAHDLTAPALVGPPAGRPSRSPARRPAPQRAGGRPARATPGCRCRHARPVRSLGAGALRAVGRPLALVAGRGAVPPGRPAGGGPGTTPPPGGATVPGTGTARPEPTRRRAPPGLRPLAVPPPRGAPEPGDPPAGGPNPAGIRPRACAGAADQRGCSATWASLPGRAPVPGCTGPVAGPPLRRHPPPTPFRHGPLPWGAGVAAGARPSPCPPPVRHHRRPSAGPRARPARRWVRSWWP